MDSKKKSVSSSRGGGILDSLKTITGKKLGWVSIAIAALAFGTAVATAGALAKYVSEGQIVDKTQGQEDKDVLETKGIAAEAQSKGLKFTPDSSKKTMQENIKGLGDIKVGDNDLNAKDVTFTTFFLAGTKMLGKGIANVNDKVESLWQNFVAAHFVKKDMTPLSAEEKDGDKITKTALDNLANPASDLAIKSDFYVGSDKVKNNLTVSGDTSLQGNTTIGTIPNEKATLLTVNGNVVIRGTLTYVGGSPTVLPAGDANFQDTRIVGTLDVTGASTLKGATTIGSRGTAVGAKWLTVNGASEFKGNADFKETLNVEKASTLKGATTIGTKDNDTATLLNVKGKSTFDKVQISDGLDLYGNLNHHGNATLQNTTINGLLRVSNRSLLQETEIGDKDHAKKLNVWGTTSLQGATTIGTYPTDLKKTLLTVHGQGLFDDLLLVKGNFQVSGSFSADGDAYVKRTFTVSGSTSLTGATTIGSKDNDAATLLRVKGKSVLDEVLINENLEVSKNSTLNGTLEVTGVSTLNGATTIGASGSGKSVNLTLYGNTFDIKNTKLKGFSTNVTVSGISTTQGPKTASVSSENFVGSKVLYTVILRIPLGGLHKDTIELTSHKVINNFTADSNSSVTFKRSFTYLFVTDGELPSPNETDFVRFDQIEIKVESLATHFLKLTAPKFGGMWSEKRLYTLARLGITASNIETTLIVTKI